jgi:tetratricopeptide (TPR) repeat protein
MRPEIFLEEAMGSSKRLIIAIIVCLIPCPGAIEAQTAKKSRGDASPRPRPGVSIQKLRAAVRANPRNAEARNALGLALGKIGQLNPAVAEFREAIALKPDYLDAWTNLGVALEQKGDLEGALEAFRKAVELNPDDAELRISLASPATKARRGHRRISPRGESQARFGRNSRQRRIHPRPTGRPRRLDEILRGSD